MKKLSQGNKILLALIENIKEANLSYVYLNKLLLHGQGRADAYVETYRLRQRGLIKKTPHGISLTKKGQRFAEKLVAEKQLIAKSKNQKGEWCLVAFDIPEKLRAERAALRNFLYRSGFRKLQASLWISPFDVYSEAIARWKKLGITTYIRTAVIKKLDNNEQIKKLFDC